MTASANATRPNSLGTSSRASTSVATKTSSRPRGVGGARPQEAAERPAAEVTHRASPAPWPVSSRARRASSRRARLSRATSDSDTNTRTRRASLRRVEREGIEGERLDGVAPRHPLVAQDRASQPGVQEGGRGGAATQQRSLPCRRGGHPDGDRRSRAGGRSRARPSRGVMLREWRLTRATTSSMNPMGKRLAISSQVSQSSADGELAEAARRLERGSPDEHRARVEHHVVDAAAPRTRCRTPGLGGRGRCSTVSSPRRRRTRARPRARRRGGARGARRRRPPGEAATRRRRRGRRPAEPRWPAGRRCARAPRRPAAGGGSERRARRSVRRPRPCRRSIRRRPRGP